MEHRRFDYKDISDLRNDIEQAGLDLPVSENFGLFAEPIEVYGKTIPNRLIIHPMEGCDGNPDNGAPAELTRRRYLRFGAGGAGLLWVEACAVVPEARANPRQIWITRDNIAEFKAMQDEMLAAARESMGADFRPYTVLQLTHSGRYSKPGPDAESIVTVAEHTYLDPYSNPKRRVITDEELEALEDKYVEAARLAKEVGFDAVDIKGCHGYLISELLGARLRPGKYGGSFENRTRFYLNIIDKVKAQVDIDITTRINAYDAIPAPYGWGCDGEGNPDLAEPKLLMQMLEQRGVQLVNITTGNPYYNPHVGRPSDMGAYVGPEHQTEAAYRMLNIIRELKAAAPSIKFIGTGFSWFRQYGANIAAGCMEQGWFDMAGFGRQAFAYPDFAKDILLHGGMDAKKCCIACTKCTEIMRFGGKAGCVIRDSKVYLPIWKEATDGRTMMNTRPGIHV